MLPLPPVALTASDYPRLEQTARGAAQKGDMDAMLLLAEINRAEIVPDDARDVESIVTIGSWVTSLTDWGAARKRCSSSGLKIAPRIWLRSPFCRAWVRRYSGCRSGIGCRTSWPDA